ncbi:alkaline phosphatase family protein [Cohnella sp. REN36]|uniref:alkaline phosphatase family protein n=1 Tax=Cohnella sp. REN36 TaxID=2887347 RepID=UPI001D142DC8|nr:alkaline phosphatase family protein [Cohnella sp. REN36]MCC3374304.1 alkaline phosphatase family protein [Cohnella sp. REN36]
MANAQSQKVVMVVLDGLRYDAARRYLGFMEHLVEHGNAVCRQVRSELPSLSRPLYEVLLTGTPAYRNGITANSIVRQSRERSLFHLASEAGLTTAAAAYHWVSELYNAAPFHPLTDRHQHDPARPIQHGMFYFEDHYPDSHLFADAEHLRRAHDPDFLYIHSMNIDDDGHKFGGESKEYAGAVRIADSILAMLVPQWLSEGYLVVVTADHGMSAEGQHGGTDAAERLVPFYLLGRAAELLQRAEEDSPIPQLQVMPYMCSLLGLAAPVSVGAGW